MDIQAALKTARAHHQAGRVPEAEALYRQVLQQQPDHPEATHLLGLVAQQCGATEAAVALMARSIALGGENPHFLLNFGEVLRGAGRWPEAIDAYNRALRQAPAHPEALYGLAIATEKSGDVEEAKTILRQTLAAAPRFHRAHLSLGALLEHEGEFDQALQHYQQALDIQPDYARARVARAHILLRSGRLAEAWPDYEWRWRVERFPGRRPDPRILIWDGSDLAGKTILIYTEQGLGDAIQFARYVPYVADRGGRVVLQCNRNLARLFANIRGVAEIADIAAPPPACDVQFPLLSAPAVFKTTLETIPRHTPYLAAPASASAEIGNCLAGASGLKVGVCWAGGASQAGRSVQPQELLASLVGVPGVSLVNLQFGGAAELPANPPLFNPMTRVADFADTAAVISQLDVVISIDTAVAHLAGAMGKPVWVLLKAVSDWRWLLDRSDSPWYPTMRLFRQTTPDDWSGTIGSVTAALHEAARTTQ